MWWRTRWSRKFRREMTFLEEEKELGRVNVSKLGLSRLNWLGRG